MARVWLDQRNTAIRSAHLPVVGTAPTASSGTVRIQAVLDRLLIVVKPIRRGQPRAAIGGIRGGNGTGDNAPSWRSPAHGAKQGKAYIVYHYGLSLRESLSKAAGTVVEGHPAAAHIRAMMPSGHHSAVKYLSSVLFRPDAARHQWRLSGVEAGYGTAGHGYKT